MTDHLDPRQLAAFRSRTLAARELLACDAHLAACADCRAALAASAPARPARALLRAARGTALEHLRYDQIAAYIDDRADSAARAAVDAHLARCARCAREVASLRAVAPELARALPAGVAAAGKGWLGGIAQWLGGAGALRPIAAMLVVAAGVALLVPREIDREPDEYPAALRALADRNELDRSALDRLPPALAAAVREERRDEAITGLRERVAANDAAAKAALALLLLPAEPKEAERLLIEAAGQDEPSAAPNLAVLYARGTFGADRGADAIRWYERAGNAARGDKVRAR